MVKGEKLASETSSLAWLYRYLVCLFGFDGSRYEMVRIKGGNNGRRKIHITQKSQEV